MTNRHIGLHHFLYVTPGLILRFIFNGRFQRKIQKNSKNQQKKLKKFVLLFWFYTFLK